MDLDRLRPRSILYKLQLEPLKEPDFKFELLPLHSPLLRQSLLVSFPPLIDMLKFSGYPYLIRGQFYGNKRVDGQPDVSSKAGDYLLRLIPRWTANAFQACPGGEGP